MVLMLSGRKAPAFKMEITMAVGQILTFRYTFLTDADTPGAGFGGTDANDFAFATLSLGGALQQYSVIADGDDALFTPPSPGVFDFSAGERHSRSSPRPQGYIPSASA